MARPPSLAQPPVLLVDDESRYRETLIEAIGVMGFEVKGVSTAEAAIRLLSQGLFGIAVLDLNLPGMGGMELVEVIRRDYPTVQVVILTSFGDLDSARKAMRHDVVDFITKPCQLDELEVSLSRACHRRRRLLMPGAAPLERPDVSSGPTSLDEVERACIMAAMKRHQGNRRAVAEELGISLRTLYNRLKDYRQRSRPSDES